MKKPIKRILWGLAIVAGLLLITSIVFILNFYRATKAMTPSDTAAVNDSVWCVKDRFVNAFIFKGEQGYLLIDAGISEKSFEKEMMKIGIRPDQVTTLLLTHTDGDHIGAIPLFKNASIYIHKEEEQMINGTTGKSKFFKTVRKLGPYNLFEGNDSLSIDGLIIKVIHTPGHTPGSSCFIIGNDYLVTGDNLALSEGKYTHFVEKFNMNTPQQEESLKILPDPDSIKYILTSHSGIVRN